MKTTKRIIALILVFVLLATPLLAFAASGSTKVYITDTGKKYHCYGCRYLSQSCHEVTLEYALSLGLTACSVCHAPSSDGAAPSDRSTPTSSLYTDVYTTDYYYNAVVDLSNRGIVGGFSDGSFKPNQKVTRAQLAVMLVNARDIDRFSSPGSNFTDVPKSHWAYSFISAAAGAGFITGYTDGSFKPEELVTYNEALTMIVASLGYKMSDLKGSYPKCFTDKAKEIGILNTCNKIGTGNATRAEVSCFLSDSFYTLNW